MIIAVPANDETTICTFFGNTRGFAFFEITEGKLMFIDYKDVEFENFSVPESATEVEIHIQKHAAFLDVLKGIDAMVVQKMGEKIHTELSNAGIKVLFTEETSVFMAMKLFGEGELSDQPIGGFMN